MAATEDPPSRTTSPAITLRPLVRDDARFLHALWHEPEVRAALYPARPPPEPEQVQAWIEARVTEPARVFVIERDRVPIGYVGIQTLKGTGEHELLYALTPSAWGRGLAVEAGRMLLARAARALGSPRLVAVVHPDNTRSARVLEKLGFRRAGMQAHGGSEHIRFERAS